MRKKFWRGNVVWTMLVLFTVFSVSALPGCAFLKKQFGGEQTSSIGIAVHNYEFNVPLGYINTQTILKQLIATGSITDAAKTQAVYNQAAQYGKQAGGIFMAWFDNPTEALFNQFTATLKNATDLLMSLFPGATIVTEPMMLKASTGATKVYADKRIIIKQKPGAPLKFTVTPVMIELALNAIFMVAQYLMNQFGNFQFTAEEKAGYMASLKRGQDAIPMWQ